MKKILKDHIGDMVSLSDPFIEKKIVINVSLEVGSLSFHIADVKNETEIPKIKELLCERLCDFLANKDDFIVNGAMLRYGELKDWKKRKEWKKREDEKKRIANKSERKITENTPEKR